MKSVVVSLLVTIAGFFLFQILLGIKDLIRENIRFKTLIAIAPDPSSTRIQYEIAGSEKLMNQTKADLPKVIIWFVISGAAVIMVERFL